MLRVSNIKLNIDDNKSKIKSSLLKKLKIKETDLIKYFIYKESVDARKKGKIDFVYTVDVVVKNEDKLIKKKLKDVVEIKQREYVGVESGTQKLQHRPVVIGSGPAGLFASLVLAQRGYMPIMLERGLDVDNRTKDIDNFWVDRKFKNNSNVQFGEGGAGTFSDGKLNTLVKDPSGRNHEVLKRFVQAGAPSEIIYQQKPHLGTDVLVGVVETLRHEIEEMGGEFQFRSKVTDLFFENSQLKEIEINGEKRIPAQVCVLAVGHSARDSFSMFEKKGIYMEPKSFAVGVRMEHPQSMINLALYGEEENEKLGAAAYKVTHTCENGRGVYSFCMCPGGYVVNASSEPEMLAVNGMSYQARDSRNANSAMIVTVTPDDFPGTDVLAGVEFQRKLEKAAYGLCDGKVPVQLFGDFCRNVPSTMLGEVEPCIKGQYELSNVRTIFPQELSSALEEGIKGCEALIHGFSRSDAVLSGVESRTSSPVRIIRNTEFESELSGLYPCGEGAGYAGGITSAAMDGLKIAEAIAKKYVPCYD